MPIQRKKITREQAMERLKTLCVRSEQCEFEVERKMFNWGINTTDRNEIISVLREERFIDNERFAKSYANDKAKFSCWGPYKIKMELSKRRINSAIINKVVSEIENEIWKNAILKCVRSKSRNLDIRGEGGKGNREKIYRYLLGRGFPSSASLKAVSFIRNEQENKD